MSRPAREADASFGDGLLLGLLVGAGLVLVLSPAVRSRVLSTAQQFGLDTTPPSRDPAAALAAGDAGLPRVAPPADPLGSTSPPA
ncbi:MAG TPA: hypothetical protein VKY74_18225 [Chloroflexia bacterium]|nr:hypothetical protein [Chloroflexia bacterium]